LNLLLANRQHVLDDEERTGSEKKGKENTRKERKKTREKEKEKKQVNRENAEEMKKKERIKCTAGKSNLEGNCNNAAGCPFSNPVRLTYYF